MMSDLLVNPYDQALGYVDDWDRRRDPFLAGGRAGFLRERIQAGKVRQCLRKSDCRRIPYQASFAVSSLRGIEREDF